MTNVDPLQNVLQRLEGVRPSGNGYSALCPAHPDTHQSLSVKRGDDGKMLVHCHAGCSFEAVCAAMGVTEKEMFAPMPNGKVHPRIIATYDYRDENGALLFQTVRYHPKTFKQRRPDGEGRWAWNLKGVRRVLYRLPELLAADPNEWVIIAEGEKDVERLRSTGFTSTTNPLGAGKWRLLSDDKALEGHRVAIVPDRDDAGHAHVGDVARRLAGRAKIVRVVELPGPGKDANDWLDAGGTAEELKRLIEAAPDYEAPKGDAARGVATPTIFIDVDEHRVVSEATKALRADPTVFQRGCSLVRVVRDFLPKDGIERIEGTPIVQPIPTPNLRERLTRLAAFEKVNRCGNARPLFDSSGTRSNGRPARRFVPPTSRYLAKVRPHEQRLGHRRRSA